MVTASEALHLILCCNLQGCKFTENYRIPSRLRWEYGTVPVAFSTTDMVPYPQILRTTKQWKQPYFVTEKTFLSHWHQKFGGSFISRIFHNSYRWMCNLNILSLMARLQKVLWYTFVNWILLLGKQQTVESVLTINCVFLFLFFKGRLLVSIFGALLSGSHVVSHTACIVTCGQIF